MSSERSFYPHINLSESEAVFHHIVSVTLQYTSQVLSGILLPLQTGSSWLGFPLNNIILQKKKAKFCLAVLLVVLILSARF